MRVLALFDGVEVDAGDIEQRPVQSFWIDVEAGLNEKLFKHLDRYIISEQVEVADKTAEFAQFHLAGPDAQSILTRLVPSAPPLNVELNHALIEMGETSCHVRRHDPLGLPGYDLLCPREKERDLRQALLDAGAAATEKETYNILRIEAGTPVYGMDIDDNRFVVEVGRTKAISYSKGCYLGQEPIVMARDRGHVNRTLLGLKVSGSTALPASTVLTRDGKDAGQVTSSVVSPRIGVIALAYVRRGNQEPGTRLEFATGEISGTAEVVSLPFSS